MLGTKYLRWSVLNKESLTLFLLFQKIQEQSIDETESQLLQQNKSKYGATSDQPGVHNQQVLFILEP